MNSQRRGFTLVEVTVVSGLMTAFAVLLASVWSGVGHTAADLVLRSQLVQERDLAVVALSRDLCGNLGGPDRTGSKQMGRWIAWDMPTNSEDSAHRDLRLLYDGNGNNDLTWTAPNTAIRYTVEDDALIRWDEFANQRFVVARYVDSLQVTAIAGRPDAFNLVLCFKYRTRTLTCDLTAEIP